VTTNNSIFDSIIMHAVKSLVVIFVLLSFSSASQKTARGSNGKESWLDQEIERLETELRKRTPMEHNLPPGVHAHKNQFNRKPEPAFAEEVSPLPDVQSIKGMKNQVIDAGDAVDDGDDGDDEDEEMSSMDWVAGEMEDWSRGILDQDDYDVNDTSDGMTNIIDNWSQGILDNVNHTDTTTIGGGGPEDLQKRDGHSGPGQLLGAIQGSKGGFMMVGEDGWASWIPTSENVTAWVKVQQDWMVDSASTMFNSSMFNSTSWRSPRQIIQETGLEQWAPTALQPSQMMSGFQTVMKSAAFNALDWSLGVIPLQWILDNVPLEWTLQYLPIETAMEYIPVDFVQNLIPEEWSLDYIQMELLPDMGLGDSEEVLEKVAGAVNSVSWLPGSKEEVTSVVFTQSTDIEDVGRSLLDPNSLQHASSGMITYVISSWLGLFPGLGPLLSMGLAFVWDTLKDTQLLNQWLGQENADWLRSVGPYETPSDSKLNVLGDMVSSLAGYTAAAAAEAGVGSAGPAAAFLALEAGSVHTFSDSLSATSLDFVKKLYEKHSGSSVPRNA